MAQYEIMFDDAVDPDALRQALGEFGIPGERMSIGEPDPDSAIPVAILIHGEEGLGFSEILRGDTGLAEATHMSELELGRFLAPRLGVRVLVDDRTEHPDRWVLVAQDGSYGRVITDGEAADEGDIKILHATEPIAGAPELPVVPDEDWAR